MALKLVDFGEFTDKHKLAPFYGPRCTMWVKKHATLLLGMTWANVDWFSKLFQHLIRRKILSIHTTEMSILLALCCYTTLWNRKSKNVNEFARRTWQLIRLINKFNVRSYVTCHKNITLMILHKYVHNIRSIANKKRRRCKDNHGKKSPGNNVHLNNVQLLIASLQVSSVKFQKLVSQCSGSLSGYW